LLFDENSILPPPAVPLDAPSPIPHTPTPILRTPAPTLRTPAPPHAAPETPFTQHPRHVQLPPYTLTPASTTFTTPARQGLTSTTLVVPKALPEFKGERDAEAFLEAFEEELAAYGLDPQVHWRRLLPKCLDKLDASWVRAFFNMDVDWAAVKTQFISDFGD